MKSSVPSLFIDDDEGFDLTNQQRIFVESMFAGMTVKQAKARAGYTPRTRVEALLREHPQMTEYAQFLQRQEKKKYSVSREQVTKGLLEAIDDAKTLEEPNTQIAGWRELGKLHGLYEPEEKKVTLSHEKAERLRQVEEASVDELLDMAGQPVIEGDFELIDAD